MELIVAGLLVDSRHTKGNEEPNDERVIRIPFEDSFIELRMDGHVEVIELIPPYIEPLNRLQLVHSIRNPIGSAPLSEIVKGRKNVVTILENATRPLNTSLIASLIVEELTGAGVSEENITFLFANGAHKDMEEYNFERKLGERFRNFTVVNHDCEAEMAELGRTRLGSPILINPLVLEADVRIAVGTIEPHYGDGVSGGAKILFPGCAGLEWIFNNHSLRRGELGVLDNEWRNDTEEAARMVGIDFLVNAVLNYKRDVIGLYCGDWINAHREGASLSLKASTVTLPYKADFCIAGSAPFDLNFIQALKGIDVTRAVLKEDGSYVMLASCPQGLGNHRWLLDERMMETRRKQNADYDSAMTEFIYSRRLSETELHSFCPQQVKLVDNIGGLKQVVTSFDRCGRKGIILPYSPITIVRSCD